MDQINPEKPMGLVIRATVRYHASVFQHALRDALRFAWSQGLPITLAITIIGIATGIVFWHRYAQSADSVEQMRDILLTGVVSTILPVSIVGLAIFFVFLVRAPADLAEQARSAYIGLELTRRVLSERIGELEGQLASRAPDLTFKVEYWAQLMMSDGGGTPFGGNLLIELSIRNSGERTALSDWALEIPSIIDEPISPRVDPWQEYVLKNLRDRTTGGRLTRDLVTQTTAGLNKGDIARGALVFLIPKLSREIHGDSTVTVHLSCLDARGEKHVVQSEMPAIKISA